MTKFKVSYSDSQIFVKSKLDKSVVVSQEEIALFNAKLIRGLMRPKVTGNRKIEYSAPGNVSLHRFLQSGISMKEFYIIFAQFIECIKKIEYYGLNINNLVMNTEYTFYNQTTREVQFLYQPLKNSTMQNNVFAFIYSLASETVARIDEGNAYLNDLISFSSQLQSFSTETMENYIMRVYPQVYKTVKKMRPGDSTNLKPTGKTYFEKKYDTVASNDNNSANGNYNNIPNYNQGGNQSYNQNYGQNSGQGYNQGYAQNSGQGYNQGYAQNGGQGYNQGYAQNGGQGYNQGYAQNSSQGCNQNYYQNNSQGYNSSYSQSNNNNQNNNASYNQNQSDKQDQKSYVYVKDILGTSSFDNSDDTNVLVEEYDDDFGTDVLIEADDEMGGGIDEEEGTTVLGGNEGTTLLEYNEPQYPYLVRINNYEKIKINKPVFRVGKEKSYVDYFVMNNNAVSRIHADIITEDNHYFVKDNNSTNHTFINGTMIGVGQRKEIFDGDALMLANEPFEFHID